MAQGSSAHLRGKTVFVVESVQHRGHLPTESHRFPYPRQRTAAISVDTRSIAFFQRRNQGVVQIVYVGHRKIQAFGTCGRHNMGGVPDQKQTTPSQRFANKGPQGCN